jgi:hypothetical protein
MDDNTVMLSAAKHLAAHRERPFAALRACPERSEGGDSVGADVSALGRFPDIPMKKVNLHYRAHRRFIGLGGCPSIQMKKLICTLRPNIYSLWPPSFFLSEE